MKKGATLALLLILSLPAHAAILDAIGGINAVLYGIAAGIAVLMITIHALKWKTAESAGEREDARKGMVNVILALLLIMIAAAIVGVLFIKPTELPAPSTTSSTTSATTTTTTVKTTTTTSTTTSVPPEKLLTAKNLVDCMHRVGGSLESIEPVSGCPHCRHIKCTVFAEEKTAPVGPGLPQYKRIPPIDVSVGPHWVKADGSYRAGCMNMTQINDYYGCGLVPVEGHKYFPCKEAHNPIEWDCEP